MTKSEKQKFVNDVMEGITKSVLSNIHVMPEEWDGFELRQYILDKTRNHVGQLNKKQSRYQNYKNFVLVNNL